MATTMMTVQAGLGEKDKAGRVQGIKADQTR
jgi:hypothetical protein